MTRMKEERKETKLEKNNQHLFRKGEREIGTINNRIKDNDGIRKKKILSKN